MSPAQHATEEASVIEKWTYLEANTSLLEIDGCRLLITTCGEISPERWWAIEKGKDRLWVLEKIAGRRLRGMADAERDRLVREVLDDGRGGGPLLRRYVRHHQRQAPDQWPAGLRLAVLQALAVRVPPARFDQVRTP